MATIPLKGDRSAFDVTNFPEKHASDLEAATPVHHVPAGNDPGDVPTWDGSKYAPAPGAGPGSFALDDLSDVNAPSPNDGDVLTWQDNPSGGEWASAAPTGGDSAFIDLTDAPSSYSGAAGKIVQVNGDGTGVEFGVLASLIDPYGIHHRLSGSHSDDDEFSSDTLANYTTVTPAGTATWSIANHCLHAYFTSQLTQDAACVLKSITMADGEWIETAVRTMLMKLNNFSMVGLIISDGTATSSNAMSLTAYQDNSAGGLNVRFDKGTITGLTSPLSTVNLDSTSQNGLLRLRLKRVSSTAYGWFVATESGGLYHNWGSANQDPGFTPTHAGVFVSTWGGVNKSIASFDYFRHMS